MHNSNSIYTTEAFAILQALNIIEQNNISKAIIYSELSLSTLSGIKNMQNTNNLSRKIQNQISTLKLQNISIVLIWIPTQIGIHGNETADCHA